MADNVVINDNSNTNQANTNLANSEQAVSDRGTVVAIKGVVLDAGAAVEMGQKIGLGDQLATQAGAAIVVKFPGGGLLVLGHNQSVDIDQRLLDLIRKNEVKDSVEEGIDFDRLQQGLEEGLSLEELLPATAAGAAPTGGGANGSSAGTGVRFIMTGDETIPLAGFETTPPSIAFPDPDAQVDPIDSAPEAVDDLDEVTSIGIATGNVVTGIDVASGDENTLDGNADDSGINGFGDAIVIGVAVGDTEVELTDNSGVGVELVSDKGTLTLNADGSYNYVPNRDASGTDVFTYTIIDSDDDTSFATLTINIDGIPLLEVTDPGENPDGTLVNTVDEAGLPNGTDAGSGVEVTSGVINYLPGDGPATVTIAGVEVIDSNGQVQGTTIQGTYGTLVITSVSATQITYTYTLTDAADHSAGPVNDVFPIQIVDSDGNAADDINGNLLINIIDDTPIAEDQEDAIDSSLVATGNVITGIDIPGGDANTSDGETDIAGADGFGAPTVVGVVAGETTETSDTGVGIQVSSDKGTIVINTDGSYTYTANPGVFGEDVFTYTMTDSDGSTDVAIIRINVDAANILEDADESNSLLSGESVSGNVLANTDNPDGPEPAVVLTFNVNGTEFQAGETANIPGIGSIVINSNGGYTFNANANFAGTVPPISYTLTDGPNTEDSQLNLTVIDPNVPPVASDDSSAGNTTNQPVVVDVLANDSDVDGTLVPSTVQIIGTPAPGTDLTVAGEGVWSVNSTTGEITFTPESGFTSDPTPINYVVSDDDGESSNTATVTISYTAQPPTAVIDSSLGNQTNQPVTVDVLANDSDPDGTLDPATVQIVGTPGAGDPLVVPGEGTWTVNTVTGEITFTPEAGFTADPTPISYTVADNDGNVSNTATVTIDYGVQPPVANNDTSNGNPTNQPVTVDVLGNDSDPDGNLDPTTVQIAGTGNPGDPLVVPGEGTWSVNPTTGAITFTPESGFTSDPTPISYTVQDNDGNLSNSATVTIDYSAQDPGANDDNETGVTNNPVTVDALANDNDPDGTLNPASVTITGSTGAGASLVVAGEGTWSVNTANGEITFTPEAGFTADPTPITYTVEDNDGNVSNTATVTIDYAVQPPVASNDSSNGNTTNQPVTVDVLNNDNDPDGNLDPATVQITGTPNEGDSLTVPGEGVWSVNTTTGEITFTPEPGFTADPTPITYTVKDNDGNESNTATVTVDYSTQEPGANDDSENGVTNNPVTVDVLDNDTDPDGTLDPATVQITGTSNAGDPLVVAGEGEWTVNTTTGEITFTPEAGFTADPTPITYTVDDNDGNTSNTATVTIDYAVQPPVAVNDTSSGNTTNQPVTVDVLGNDSDPDGNLDPSTVQINGTANPGDSLAVPGEGTWSVNPTTGAITFTPEAGFTADPTPITYTVQDNDGNVSNPATVTVDYDAQDPTAGDDSENGVTNNPVTVDTLANDNDPDGTLNPASVTITGSTGAGASLVVAGEGTWSVNTANGEITFTPEAGFTADPTPITYTVEDNDGNVSNTATVTIDYAVQPPVASNDSSNGNTTNQPVTVDVLNNDNDPDGNLDPATVQITGTPNEGDSLTVPGEGVWSVNTTTGEITFTPESGFTADPTPISYTVKDNDGNESNTATVTVDYSTQEPGANDDSENGVTNNPVTVDVLDNDTDPDGTLDPATVQITGTSNAGDPLVVAGEGEWTVNTTTGEITFTPESGFTADPTPITYTVDDNDGNTSNTATVTIDYAVQPPVATNDVSNGNPLNTPVTVDVVANDSDPDGNIDPTTVQIVGPSGPVSSLPVAGEGTWSVNPTTGAITFTPEPGFISDPTPISYTVEDNDGNVSNPAAVDVNYETAPTLSVQDITVNEADGTISITVSLSQTVSSDVTFSFQTNEGDEDSNPNNEATADSDFDTTSGSGTITAGTLTTTISVPMNDDFVREGDENFLVNLTVSSSNIDIAGSDLQGVVTIQDAGSPGQPEPPTGEDTVTLKVVATDSAGNIIGDGSENDSNEGGAAYYKVIALDPAGNEIASPAAGTVDVTFTNGTAGDADYDNATQNVTIGQVFQVDATDDLISDDEETYNVSLGANGTIAGAITTAYEAVTNSTDTVETTIHDETSPGTPPGPGPHPTPTPNPGPEDTVFAVIDSNGPVTEGADSVFTVSLFDVNGNPVTVTSDMEVNVVFANGTAEDGDYTATAQTVTVSAGDSTTTVTVPTAQDADFDDETFTATIAGVGAGASQFENVDTTTGVTVGGTPRTPSAEATINDDDVPPTVSIDDVTVNEDAGTMTFTVSLSNSTTQDVSFDFDTNNGSATAGADYTAIANGSGTITAGQTTTTITVNIADDYIAEGNETYTVDLSNLSGNTATSGHDLQGLGTIVDAGSPPGTIPPGVPPEVPGTPDTVTLKVVATDSAGNIIGDGSENDSNEGGAAYYKVIALDPAGVEITSPAAGTVDVTFTNGTAGDADYDNVTQNVTIGQVFQVDATDDLISDDEETYTVNLGANSTIAGAITTAYEAVTNSTDTVETTIHDETSPGTPPGPGPHPTPTPNPGPEDTVFAVIDSNGPVTEGADSVFTVSLFDVNGNPVTVTSDMEVNVVFANGTAEDGDYTATAQTVTVAAGDSTTTVTVPTSQDADFDDETFTATIAGVGAGASQFENVDTTTGVTVGGTPRTPSAEATINDDDVPPTVSIDDVTVNEDAGTMTFTVSLSNSTTQDVTFDFDTNNGSATAGADYTAIANGSGTITAGQTTTTITVNIADDYIAEGNETYTVDLSNLSGNTATSGHDLQGLGTIVDAGSPPGTIPPGVPPEVPGAPDTVTLKVVATDSAGNIIGDGSENDSNEGGAAYYKVIALDPAGNEIASPAAGTVDVTFTNGTAGDADYDNATQNVTIGQVFQVDATDDLISDDEETYNVSLGANGTIAGAITTAYEAVTNSTDTVETTIHDETSPGTPPGPGPHPTPTPNPGPEDTVFAVIDSNGPVTEGADSVFTVSLFDVNGNPVTVTSDMEVNVVFANGTAEDGDYTATAQTVTVSAGDSTTTVTVPTAQDADFDDETFTATIAGVGAGASQFENVDTTTGVTVGGTPRTPSAEATINDDDVPPTVSIDDVTVNEDAGTMTFTVSLSNSTTQDVSFDFDTNNGSATAGADYTAIANGSGTITAGQTTTTITVNIADDYIAEGNETYTVDLSNLSGNTATSGHDLQGLGTIVDAGSPPGTIPPGVPPEVPGTPDTVTLKVVATDSAGNIIGDGSENDSNEGGAAYYKVIALDPAGVEITSPAAGTVDVTFTNGTAGDADYDNVTQNVTIGQVFQVDATDDLISDDEETYTVNLGANSTIAGAITTAYEAVTNSTDTVETTIHDETSPGTPPGPGPHPTPTPNPGPEDTVFAVIDSNGPVTEGADSVFTVSLFDVNGNPVTVTSDMEVNVVFANGTAEDGDYTATAQTVTVAAGDSTTTVTVPTSQDADFDDETFTATIAGVGAGASQFENVDTTTGVTVGGTPRTPSAEATINDDDVPPTVSIDDVTVNEDAGTMTFTVSLSNSTTQDVSFDFDTNNGSATAGADYTAIANGSGTITAGQTTTTITVNIADDYIAEGNETYTVDLSNLSGNTATSGHDLQGLGTIVDAGSPPGTIPPGVPPEVPGTPDTVTLKVVATDSAGNIIGDGSENDSNEGGAAYYKVIALDPAGVEITSPAAGTVDVTFTNGTAGDADYDNVTQNVTIGQVFQVDATDDLISDDEETYTVNLGANSTIAGAITTAYEAVTNSTDTVETTIHDETSPGTPPGPGPHPTPTPNPGPEDTVFAVIDSNGPVTEGADSVFTVSLFDVNGNPVTVTSDMEVNVVFANGTAEDGDYTATAQTVTVAAGDSTTTVTVPTSQDADFDDETFTATIAGVGAGASQFENVDTTTGVTVGGTPRTPSAEATINDDDVPPTVSIDDVTVNEDAGTMTFTVSLSNSTTQDVTFDFDTNNGSATAGADYTAIANGSGTITAGQTTTTITVNIADDYIAEGNETYTVDLSNLSGNTATSGHDLQGLGTIVDAGSPPGTIPPGVPPEVPGAPDTVTLKVVATDSAGNIIGDGSENDSNEGGAAYYKVIALDPAGNEIASPAAGTVDVTFTNGTAGDADYDNATQNVTIGQVFQVDATDDLISDDEETYTVNLGANGTIAGAITTAYEAVTNSTDTVETTIHDETSPGTPPGPGPHPTPTPNPGPEDTVFAEISVDQSSVEEGGQLTYTVTLVDNNGNAVSVPAGDTVEVVLDWTGLAAVGGDTSALPTSVNVTGSQMQFVIDANDDFIIEGSEPLVATITSVVDTDSNFEQTAVGTQNVANSAITDEATPDPDDTVQLKVVATDSAGNILGDGSINATNEGEAAYYKVIAVDPAGNEIASPAAGSVDVVFTNGTAGDADYANATQNVAIGSVFQTTAVDDLLSDDEENFTVSLGANSTITGAITSAYEAVTNSTDDVTTTIHDETTPGGPPGTPTPGPEDTVFAEISVDQSSVEEGGQLTYTVTLVDNNGNPVTVPAGDSVEVVLDWTGLAATGGDTSALPASVNVSGSQAQFTVDANDDFVAEGSEPLVATITSVVDTDNNFEQTAVGTQNVANSAITDESSPDPDDTVTLKVVATDSAGNIIGDGSVNATNEGEAAYYKVIALDPAGNEIASPAAGTVDISFTNGSAGNSDYDNSSQNVVIGQVFQTTAVDDLISDDEENFTVTIDAGSVAGAITSAYEAVATSTDDVTTTIHDETTPGGPPGTPTPGPEDTVYAVIESNGAVDEGNTSVFTVSLIDQNGNPVTVTSDMEVDVVFANGTAENGDYTATAQTVTITNGNSTALVNVPTAIDADFDDETFTATIDGVGAGANQFENVDTTTGADGRTPSAEATINDVQGDVVVRINDPVGSLVEGETGTFQVGLFDVNGNPAPNATSDVTVNITYSGTATDGSDYTQVAAVTIPAGSNSVNLDIVTLFDTVGNEPDETVNMQLATVSGGGFGNISIDSANDTADLTIIDGTPTVNITGSNQVFEAGLAASGSGELADGNANNNSDTRELTTGTIEFTEGNGGASVQISHGGTTVVAAVGASIVGDNGTLTVTAIIPPSNGNPGEVQYEYELTSREDHDGTDDNETFLVSVIDNDGNVSDDASTNLVIDIVDDGPSTNGQTRVMTVDVDTIVLNSYIAGFQNEVTGTDNQAGFDFNEIQNDADPLVDQVEWGRPFIDAANGVNPLGNRSGYELVDDTGLASVSGEVVQTDQLIEFGTFTHHNWPTFANSGTITSIEMTLTVNVVINGVSNPVTLTLTLGHNETSNGNPQPVTNPDGTPVLDANGNQVTSDMDIITLPTTTQTVTVGGQNYEVSVEGFLDSNGNSVNTIYTNEEASNAFTVVGKVTSTDPLPVVTGQVEMESGADTGASIAWGAPSNPSLGTFTSGGDGSYSFEVNRETKDSLGAGDTQTLTVPYTVTDSDGSTTSSAVTIIIAGKGAVTGTGASETLNGTANGDSIVADAGNDTLNGLAGNDTLFGEAGNDILIGGAGEDILFGGTGADTFVLDNGIAAGEQDVVKDFQIGTDVLDLGSLLPDGADAATLDQYLHFEEDGSDIIVHINTDGDYLANTRDDAKDEYTIRIENADAAFFNQTDQDILQVLINNNSIETI